MRSLSDLQSSPAVARPQRTAYAITVGLLTAAFLMSLAFYGTGANLFVLCLVVATLLAALVAIGPTRLFELAGPYRFGFAVALAMLSYIAVAYRFSLSADNSFVASWVLSTGPIAFLCGLHISGNSAARRNLVLALVVIVVLFAANSAVRFVVIGERAHQPMLDPNNYATLLYLVWIPVAHWHLCREWSDSPMSATQRMAMFSGAFVIVLAIVATRSRTAMLIVVGALFVWLITAVWKRVSLKVLLGYALATGLAWLVGVAVAAANVDSSQKGLEFGSGLAVRRELIASALSMFVQHPLGVGVFCFPMLYPRYRSPLEQDTLGLFVHNDYVQFLVEGGVPLLLLLLLFVASVGRRGLQIVGRPPNSAEFRKFGLALALMAASAHALVNFVFYTLPLLIVVGLMTALLFSNGDKATAQDVRIRPAVGMAVIGAGWIMWLYLLLDVATAGVFQNQTSFGIASYVRADQGRMFEYARFAQMLNGNRGIPVLGEAILLYRAAQAEPDSIFLKQEAYEKFHQAISVDPANTLAYVRLSQFLDDFPLQGERPKGESDEELLTQALSFDPLCVPCIDQLLLHYAAIGRDDQRYALLRERTYPWMTVLRKKDPEATDRYFDILKGYAQQSGDTRFIEELERMRAALVDLAPKPETYWFYWH